MSDQAKEQLDELKLRYFAALLEGRDEQTGSLTPDVECELDALREQMERLARPDAPNGQYSRFWPRRRDPAFKKWSG